VLTGSYFLDATELGDLLPMTGTEYVTGAESREETGEPHAPLEPDPLDMQAFTYCFAMDHLPGEDHTIQKPEGYEFWRDFKPEFWPDKLFSWDAPDPATPARSRPMSLFPAEGKFPLWTYRRLIEKDQFLPGTFESDITLVNWPQNDYFLGPIYEVPEKEAAKNLRAARDQSLSLLYWLQTRPRGPKTADAATPASGCAATSWAPRTASPSTPTSASRAAYAPSGPWSNRTSVPRCARTGP
jgi:FAD dependent oxidoreductase